MSDFPEEPRICFESKEQYHALRTALVAEGYANECEQGAFLFASPTGNGELRIIDIVVLGSEHFTIQTAHFLELQEDVLQEMILRSHRTDTALVEAHSHPFTRGPRVCFSPSDRAGLADVGPQVSWRLPGRPYVALVFGWDAFDSLFWEGGERSPQGSVDLLVDGQVLRASRESERVWREDHG